MNLFGIDPSLNNTGIAYYEGDRIKTGTIPVKKLRRVSRLVFVRDTLEDYLDEFQPDKVIYEGYAFGAKGQALFDIGEMGGVLKILCYEKGIDVLLVPPATLKLFAAGKGNAKKEEMIVAINERWGRWFSSDDEADAFALLKFGEVYLNVRKRRAFKPKVIESMSKVEIVHGKQLR